MATLRDVACACGVSLTTASVALRGTASVSRETRERVQAAAARLGYAPDPMAAGLRARRFSRSGSKLGTPLVIATPGPPDPQHVLPPLLSRRAAELGYACRHERLPCGRAETALALKRWQRQGVAGLVFHRTQEPLPVDLPEWRHFALVATVGNAVPPPCHRVAVDAAIAVLTCAETLRAKGYRAIAFALGSHEQEIDDDRARHAAALLARENARPGERVLPLFREAITSPRTPDRWRAWFAEHRPDAVVGFNHVMRVWLEEAGWVSPRDFAFATLHRMAAWPDESGHDAMHEECCRTTIELLDQLVRYRETGWPNSVRCTLVASHWIEGGTTPPADKESSPLIGRCG